MTTPPPPDQPAPDRPPPDQPVPDRPPSDQPPPQIVYMWPPTRRTSGVAVASLVLGLLGLLGGWLLCGVPSLLAVVLGHAGATRTRSGEVAGHGMAVAGLVLGYVLLIPTMLVTLMIAYSPAGVQRGITNLVGGLTDFLSELLG